MWTLDFMGAIKSDLSRLHGITDISTLYGSEFFMLCEYLGAYEGAVAAVHRNREEQNKKKRPVPPSVKKQATPVNEVDAHAAMAMIGNGEGA